LILQGRQKIILDGREVQYTFRRSVKARYMHFEINASEGLVVVVPKRWSANTLPALIEGKKRWILKNIDRYAGYVHPFDKGYLEQGDKIPYLGRDLEVVFSTNHVGTDGVILNDDRLLLQSEHPDNGTAAQIVKQWLRDQATAFLLERVGALAAKLDLTYSRVSIRGQKSRWGSCSTKKNINLNWKLIMTLPHIIDYTIIHELLHLKEMNHSKAFWDLVEEYYPQWRQYRKWLKEHAGYLLVDA
jgi:predicted metal-dependent hydrolase